MAETAPARRTRLINVILGLLVAGVPLTSYQLLQHHATELQPCTMTHLGDLAKWWDKAPGHKGFVTDKLLYTGEYGNGQGKLWLLVELNSDTGELIGADLLDTSEPQRVVSSAYIAERAPEKAAKVQRVEPYGQELHLTTTLARMLHFDSEWQREQVRPRGGREPSSVSAMTQAGKCAYHVFSIHDARAEDVSDFHDACYERILGYLDPGSVQILSTTCSALYVAPRLFDVCAARYLRATDQDPRFLVLPRVAQAFDLLAGIASEFKDIAGVQFIASEVSGFLLSNEWCACAAQGVVWSGGKFRKACSCNTRNQWGCSFKAAEEACTAEASSSLVQLGSPSTPRGSGGVFTAYLTPPAASNASSHVRVDRMSRLSLFDEVQALRRELKDATAASNMLRTAVLPSLDACSIFEVLIHQWSAHHGAVVVERPPPSFPLLGPPLPTRKELNPKVTDASLQMLATAGSNRRYGKLRNQEHGFGVNCVRWLQMKMKELGTVVGSINELPIRVMFLQMVLDFLSDKFFSTASTAGRPVHFAIHGEDRRVALIKLFGELRKYVSEGTPEGESPIATELVESLKAVQLEIASSRSESSGAASDHGDCRAANGAAGEAPVSDGPSESEVAADAALAQMLVELGMGPVGRQTGAGLEDLEEDTDS